MGRFYRKLPENEQRFFDFVARSLHPQLTMLLFQTHLGARYAKRASQLIATTHETFLLDLDLLRRDEIWFTEKTPEMATDLYALSDIHPRHDKAIQRDYLLGRYGGIPFIGGTHRLYHVSEHSAPELKTAASEELQKLVR